MARTNQQQIIWLIATALFIVSLINFQLTLIETKKIGHLHVHVPLHMRRKIKYGAKIGVAAALLGVRKFSLPFPIPIPLPIPVIKSIQPIYLPIHPWTLKKIALTHGFGGFHGGLGFGALHGGLGLGGYGYGGLGGKGFGGIGGGLGGIG